MALTYNLKYKKLNFFHKVLLEKEGEVIIDRQSFRLKGKGAGDLGENIYFADIKELIVLGDQLKIISFHKERFVLSGFSNLFESFLKDFFRVRNDYLAEALFMKVGMLYHEYEGCAEITNRIDKRINKGKVRIQFYEGSIVVLPEMSDGFAIYLNFLKNHEFDEDEYVLRLSLESGCTVQFSKLGTMFSDARETLDFLLGKMYERVMGHLKEMLPNFDAVTLLKLAALMRDGKCVSMNVLKKVHEDLPKSLEALAFANVPPLYHEKVQFLRSISKNALFYLGLSFVPKPDMKEIQTKAWFVVAHPDQNIVAFGTPQNAQDQAIYFFRILDENIDTEEKLVQKIYAFNQSMLLFRFDCSPLYKTKFELRKTKYRVPLRKLLFLHALRQSYLGKSMAADLKTFEQETDRMLKMAFLAPKLLPAATSALIGPAK